MQDCDSDIELVIKALEEIEHQYDDPAPIKCDGATQFGGSDR